VFNQPPAAGFPPPPGPPPARGGFGAQAPYHPPSIASPASVPAPSPNTPTPPNMHWAVVLVLSWVTFGLGALVWYFKQALFVRKLDPSSKAVMMLGLTIAAMAVQVVIVLGAMSARSSSAMATASAVSMLLNLVVIVLALVTVFSMRGSIERYYNSVEPIGLRLSGVMTFFFSILYFQYHFSRIVEWKRTGRLS
jgi:uncharacterized membrane protein